MGTVLTLVKFRCSAFSFRLIWNYHATVRLDSAGVKLEDLETMEPAAYAAVLHIMGTEAQSYCRYFGLPEDDVPGAETLSEYFENIAQQFEYSDAQNSIADAIGFGTSRDHEKQFVEDTDIDTIELKKNWKRPE